MQYYKALDPATGWFILVPIRSAIILYQHTNRYEPTYWIRTATDPEPYPLVVEDADGNYKYADSLRDGTVTEGGLNYDYRLP